MENKQGWVVQVELLGIFIALMMMFFSMGSKIDSVAQSTTERTDKMYEMFVTLVKENHTHRHEAEMKQASFDYRLEETSKTMAMIGGHVIEMKQRS